MRGKTRELVVEERALNNLEALPQKFAKQVGRRITALAMDAFPSNYKYLGEANGKCYRIRSGNYRILYRVSDAEVTVYDIDDRKDVYR